MIVHPIVLNFLIYLNHFVSSKTMLNTQLQLQLFKHDRGFLGYEPKSMTKLSLSDHVDC